jgi:hypothetical protein
MIRQHFLAEVMSSSICPCRSILSHRVLGARLYPVLFFPNPSTLPYHPITPPSCILSHLSPKHPPTTLLPIRLSLHLLAHFNIDLEEFAHAAVQTHGFALVEIGFPVRGVYAFGGAGFY